MEAEQGNVEQQYALGTYYELGYDVDEDTIKALRWYPGGFWCHEEFRCIE